MEQEGFRIDIVNNGKEAVDRISLDYDCVLMDLQMPVMDGYQATSEIRKNPEYADMPIIAMTADAMVGVKERVISEGLNDYITKPFDPAMLWETLMNWIKPGNRPLPENYRTASEKGNHDGPDIPPIKGVDLADGLKRVGGNKRLYRDLLVQFARDNGSVTNEIQDCLSRNDIRSAERLAHTIKSVAGNIGAHSLQNKAEILECELKKWTSHLEPEILNDFDFHLHKVTEAITQACPGDDEQDIVEVEVVSDEVLKPLLDTLGPFLKKKMAVKCKAVLREIEQYRYSADRQNSIEELSSMIRRYNYHDAEDLLHNLMDEIDCS